MLNENAYPEAVLNPLILSIDTLLGDSTEAALIAGGYTEEQATAAIAATSEFYQAATKKHLKSSQGIKRFKLGHTEEEPLETDHCYIPVSCVVSQQTSVEQWNQLVADINAILPNTKLRQVGFHVGGLFGDDCQLTAAPVLQNAGGARYPLRTRVSQALATDFFLFLIAEAPTSVSETALTEALNAAQSTLAADDIVLSFQTHGQITLPPEWEGAFFETQIRVDELIAIPPELQ